jgi:hypothetical protein
VSPPAGEEDPLTPAGARHLDGVLPLPLTRIPTPDDEGRRTLEARPCPLVGAHEQGHALEGEEAPDVQQHRVSLARLRIGEERQIVRSVAKGAGHT